MDMTAVDVTTIEPLNHNEAIRHQANELERTLGLLRSLDTEAWTAPTDCPAWDVRAMYQHVLGACEAGASARENVHQLRAARVYRKQHGGPLEAALPVQVRERAGLSPAQIIGRLAAVAPHTVRGRTRTPALVRNHAKMAVDGPVHETWKLGYLIDTCVTCGSTASTRPAPPGGHPNRAPTTMAASSPTSSPNGPGAQHLSLNAGEFCRTLAGRALATGLLTTIVPF